MYVNQTTHFPPGHHYMKKLTLKASTYQKGWERELDIRVLKSIVQDLICFNKWET